MNYLEAMNQDADSALSLLKSIESQIRNCNFLAAIGTVGSVCVSLAEAESKRSLYFATKEQKMADERNVLVEAAGEEEK